MRQQRHQVEVEQSPQPTHGLRNALIVGGAVTAVGGGLALTGRRILRNQKVILQHAAKRAAAESFKTAEKESKIAAKAVEAAPKAEKDVHRSMLETDLHGVRHNIGKHWIKGHPDYEKNVSEVMAKVHAPVSESEIASIDPGLMKKMGATDPVAAVKRKRVVSSMADIKTEHQEAKDYSFAKELHERRIAGHFRNMGAANDSTADHPFKNYVYSKPHKAFIDPTDPPALKKKNLSRLVKLIELDFNVHEKRDFHGRFASGGTTAVDSSTLQHAYHVNGTNGGNGSNGSSPRGRGRPPGALNRRTIEAQQVHQDATEAQPEYKSNIGRNLAIAAGGLALGGIAVAPKIRKIIRAGVRNRETIERIGGKLGREMTALKGFKDAEGNWVRATEGKGDLATGKDNKPWMDNLVRETTGGIFGKRMVDKAASSGTPIEEAITNRANNIRTLREQRLENARKWKTAHPDKGDHLNPYTTPPYEPKTKVDKDVAAARHGENIAREQLKTEKVKGDLEKNKTASEELQTRLDEVTAKHEKATKSLGAANQKTEDLEGHVSHLQGLVDASVQPPTDVEKVRAAGATLKTLRDRAAAGKTGEFAYQAEDLTSEEIAAVAKHHRLHGREFPVLPASRLKQGEMFDVVNSATPGRIDSSVVPEIRGHVEFLKQENLANRKEEIRAISKEFGHADEDIAHAMALRQAAGKTAHVEPKITGIANPTERGNAVAARNSAILNRDAAWKAREKHAAKEAADKAEEHFMLKKKKKNKKASTGVQGKLSEQEKLALRGLKSEAEIHARSAHARQIQSEGAFPSHVLRQQLPVETKQISVRKAGKLKKEKQTVSKHQASAKKLMTFSARLRARLIQLHAPMPELIELSSFIRDVPIKHLPGNVQEDIGKFIKVKAGTHVSHYGMVADELVSKADPHNLNAARMNVEKRMSQKAASEEVHGRREKKPILIMNDRIVDGHHFLAKAQHGKVSSSLHVIDLTPARFQMSALQPGMIECGSSPRLTPVLL